MLPSHCAYYECPILYQIIMLQSSRFPLCNNSKHSFFVPPTDHECTKLKIGNEQLVDTSRMGELY